MNSFVRRYRKFLLAAAAGVAVLVTALADGNVTGDEVYLIIIAILGPAGVGLIPNDPKEVKTTRGSDSLLK